MSYKLELTIPQLPPLQAANGRKHWRVRWREEQTWKQRVQWAALARGTPEEPVRRARIVCTRLSTQQPDGDNLATSFKPCLDGLKGLVIVDDSPEHVTVSYGWERAKRGQGGVRIVVEAME
jgi:hypothetical protein